MQGERVVTFDVLRHAIGAKARELVALEVERGARVFLLGWNSPEWIVSFWAARDGAILVLANGWWSAGELADALVALQPALTLVDAYGAAKMPPAWRCGPWAVDTTHAPTPPRLAPTRRLGRGRARGDHLHLGDRGASEGRRLSQSRAARGTADAVACHAQAPTSTRRDGCRRRPAHRPAVHVGGVQTLLRAITVGSTLVMPRGKYDPADALDLIERHKVGRGTAVPTMVSRLLDHPDVPRRDLSSLNDQACGGPCARAPSELLRRICTELAKCPTDSDRDGLTENGGQARGSRLGKPELPGSTGRPCRGVEVRFLPRPGHARWRDPAALGYADVGLLRDRSVTD